LHTSNTENAINNKAYSIHKTIKSIITLTKVQIILDYSKFYSIFATKI
jgi:hypothetical protein